MKSGEFGALLRAYADVLGSSGARNAEQQVIGLASLFDLKSSDPVKTVVGRLTKLSPSMNTGQPNLGEISRWLDGLHDILQHAAKPPVVADLLLIRDFLRNNAAIGLDALAEGAKAPVAITPKRVPKPKVQVDKAALVSRYLTNLTDSLRDEAKFMLVFDALGSDKAMGKPETVMLAKQFTEASVCTKKDALKKILGRHQSLMEFEARQKSTAGRTAA